MEARPHPLVEAFIGWLLPPACREHVLGDLYERNVSTSQYVGDAARTIPFAIWGQIRRTSSAPLVAAELGAVYVAFLSALGSFPGAFGDRSAPLRVGIPALAALAAVVIRDAWVGKRPRPNASHSRRRSAGIACAAVSQTLLAVVGSPLALPSNVLWAGSATGLALLSGVRIALSPGNSTAIPNAGEDQMNSASSNAQGRMQRDLRLWWWTIAVLGLSGWLGLFLYPGMSRYRPFLLAWLVAFAAICCYQRQERSGRCGLRKAWQQQTRGKRIERSWSVDAISSPIGQRANRVDDRCVELAFCEVARLSSTGTRLTALGPPVASVGADRFLLPAGSRIVHGRVPARDRRARLQRAGIAELTQFQFAVPLTPLSRPAPASCHESVTGLSPPKSDPINPTAKTRGIPYAPATPELPMQNRWTRRVILSLVSSWRRACP